MRQLSYGTARCGERTIRYDLLVEELAADVETYGVSASMEGEETSIAYLTISQRRIETLLERLRRGSVTPVALRDVVEDWLEE